MIYLNKKDVRLLKQVVVKMGMKQVSIDLLQVKQTTKRTLD